MQQWADDNAHHRGLLRRRELRDVRPWLFPPAHVDVAIVEELDVHLRTHLHPLVIRHTAQQPQRPPDVLDVLKGN